MSSGRFAVFSMTVPPAQRAQAILLARILKRIPPECYILISNETVSAGSVSPTHYQLSDTQTTVRELENITASRLQRILGGITNPVLLGGLRLLLQSYRRLKVRIGRLRARLRNHDAIIAARADQLEEILRQEQIDLLVVCTGGNVYNLPAAYLAAKRLSVPFVAYMFDYYSREMFAEQVVARKWEPCILESAAAVIVINEGLRDAYQHLYNLEATVIYNPCPLDISPEKSEGHDRHLRSDVFNIVYTGSIWSVYYEGFRRLAQAVNQLGNSARLHIFTSNPSFVLRLQGIDGPNVIFHAPLPQLQIRQVQREADLLVLPLSFETGFRELVNVVSTTKLGEYLAAGRAILIHAPPSAFLSSYFRKNECGVVVDKPEISALVETLQRLIADDSLRATLGQRARACAERDFDSDRISERFKQVLQSVAGFKLTNL